MTKVVKAKNTKKRPTVVSLGFDISMACVAGCAKMYDSTLNKMRGPVWNIRRWDVQTDFYTRMDEAVRAHDHVLDLMEKLHGIITDVGQVWIAVEEPWAPGYVKQAQSAWLKQQAQIQGAFLGGLIRYGYPHINEVGTKSWRSTVAKDMDMKQNKEFDKWTVKEWVEEVYGEKPWPDLIYKSGLGLVPKPKTSKAKATQPDDRFDATGVMEWCWDEAHKELKIKK